MTRATWNRCEACGHHSERATKEQDGLCIVCYQGKLFPQTKPVWGVDLQPDIDWYKMIAGDGLDNIRSIPDRLFNATTQLDPRFVPEPLTLEELSKVMRELTGHYPDEEPLDYCAVCGAYWDCEHGQRSVKNDARWGLSPVGQMLDVMNRHLP